MNLQLSRNKIETTLPPNRVSRCASSQEMIERLACDMDCLVVAALDDLSYEIVKAYGGRLPKDLLEWIGTTATNGVRRLAKAIYSGDVARRMTPAELRINSQPDSARFLAICWLRPQMERKYAPLPAGVRKVLSLAEATRQGD